MSFQTCKASVHLQKHENFLDSNTTDTWTLQKDHKEIVKLTYMNGDTITCDERNFYQLTHQLW